jgi:plastocyanin domain-containing protein
MYIVAIAWLYVTMLVSVMQPTLLRGILTFIGTGLIPLGILLYLLGSPQRRRNARAASPDREVQGAAPEPVDDAELKREDRAR